MGIFWSFTDEEKDEELNHTHAVVAIHESGHAIACRAYSIPYSVIHVSVNRTYWTGQLQYEGYVMTQLKDYPTGKAAMEYAIMCLSGMTAEAIYLMEHGWRKGKAWSFAADHAGRDMRDAQEVVGRYGMYDVEKKAKRLIEDRWSSVVRLAQQL